jgi:hypothetical protein
MILLIFRYMLLHLLFNLFILCILLLFFFFVVRCIIIIVLLRLFNQPHLFLDCFFLGHAVRRLVKSPFLLLDSWALFAEFFGNKLLGF